MFLAIDEKASGVIAVADTLKENSRKRWRPFTDGARRGDAHGG